MDHEQNYERTIHSIQTGKKLRFDMQHIFIPGPGALLHHKFQGDWCGSRGCMIGHAIIANMNSQDAHRMLTASHTEDEYGHAANLLRLTPSAATRLFSEDLTGPKQEAEFTIQVLRNLQPIAARRDVTEDDVQQATEQAQAGQHPGTTRQGENHGTMERP